MLKVIKIKKGVYKPTKKRAEVPYIAVSFKSVLGPTFKQVFTGRVYPTIYKALQDKSINVGDDIFYLLDELIKLK